MLFGRSIPLCLPMAAGSPTCLISQAMTTYTSARGTGAGTAVLIAASIEADTGLTVGARRVLFAAEDLVAGIPHANYDISPDGRTFVMVRRSPATRITVLQNLPAIVREARDAATDTH